MPLKKTPDQLKVPGSEMMRTPDVEYGEDDNQFDIKLGEIHTFSSKIKTDHELAVQL